MANYATALILLHWLAINCEQTESINVLENTANINKETKLLVRFPKQATIFFKISPKNRYQGFLSRVVTLDALTPASVHSL